MVQTLFCVIEMLQITDISSKILYEMAMGERRLLSLINATVSHEMRNPINSILMQVSEMDALNLQLEDFIHQMPDEDSLNKKLRR